MVKAGLVLEGGGMRGIYTAGVLEYFMEKNLYFPYIIGVSAGACFGASYLSRQQGRNRKVNIDYVTHPSYLSFKNFLKNQQLFGMDFLFDEMPNKIVPFDFEAFHNGKEEFVVTVTDCQTGLPLYYKRDDYGKDLLTIIRASSSLPFIAPVVEYKGKYLLDGGIVDSIPLQQAEKDGYHKNVVIMTKEESYTKKKANIRWLLNRYYPQYPKLIEAVVERHEMYNKTLEHIRKQEENGSIFVLRPSMSMKAGRIERNPKKLEKLYELGIEDAKREFTRLENWLKSQ